MDWKPIETAPADGRYILGVFWTGPDVPGTPYDRQFGGFAPLTVFFGTYHPNAPGKKEWREARSNHKVWLTHWTPLPDPPDLL